MADIQRIEVIKIFGGSVNAVTTIKQLFLEDEQECLQLLCGGETFQIQFYLNKNAIEELKKAAQKETLKEN